jgi:hypothetical protein
MLLGELCLLKKLKKHLFRQFEKQITILQNISRKKNIALE